MVGVWKGLNLGSIPNFFLCFGMHPKIIDVYPKLIPKGDVVQCHFMDCWTSTFKYLHIFGTYIGLSGKGLEQDLYVWGISSRSGPWWEWWTVNGAHRRRQRHLFTRLVACVAVSCAFRWVVGWIVTLTCIAQRSFLVIEYGLGCRAAIKCRWAVECIEQLRIYGEGGGDKEEAFQTLCAFEIKHHYCNTDQASIKRLIRQRRF